MRPLRPLSVVLLGLWMAACTPPEAAQEDGGADGAEAGEDGDLPEGEFYEGGEYWQLELRGNASEVEVVEVSSVVFPEGSHEPIPMLGGNYLVESLQDGDVVGVRPLEFAQFGRVELEMDGDAEEVELELERAPQTIFVPKDGTDAIRVVRADGSVAAEVSAEELGDAAAQFRDGNPVSDLFPHIRMFGPGDEAKLPEEYLLGGYVVEVYEPTEAQYDRLVEGLSRLPPALVSSVTGIAIVEPQFGGCFAATGSCGGDEVKVAKYCADAGLTVYDEDGDPVSTGLTKGAAIGSYLVLNANSFELWADTIAHETTHNFAFRVDVRNNIEEQDGWSSAAVADARKLVERYSLGAGFSHTWYQLHQSAYEAGVSGILEIPPHPSGRNSNWCGLTSSQAADGGYATPYGAKSVAEDIAEYASDIIVFGNDAAVCRQFDGVIGGDDLPENVALPFTKLTLLRHLGVITQSQLDACTGGLDVGRTQPGVELRDQLFDENLRAHYYMYEGDRYFGILAEGVEEWELLYDATVAEGTSPLGAHRLGGLFTVAGTIHAFPENGAYLNHPQTPRASISGLLLITEHGPEGTRGAIFNLQLGDTNGNPTSFDPYSPFFIPP